jgi:hypothetical protein
MLCVSLQEFHILLKFLKVRQTLGQFRYSLKVDRKIGSEEPLYLKSIGGKKSKKPCARVMRFVFARKVE